MKIKAVRTLPSIHLNTEVASGRHLFPKAQLDRVFTLG